MTVPDPTAPTAPTAEDALARGMCDALVETPLDEPCEGCKLQAAAAVAAVRAMTAEQQAQLVDGEVQTEELERLNGNGRFAWGIYSRLVGPWRAEP